MNIAWQYLDKRAATISALKDYENMLCIAAQSPAPPHDGPLQNIAASAVYTRHQQAHAYMAWFRPGWDALTEDERFVLRSFYMHTTHQPADPVGDVCETFHIERTSAYKKKDRAVARLALLLYGR